VFLDRVFKQVILGYVKMNHLVYAKITMFFNSIDIVSGIGLLEDK